MNYLHNVIHSFMKDHGIKPFELFHINCDMDKIGYKVYDRLRLLTVGYFDDQKEFHLLESVKKHSKPDDENFIIVNILNGNITVFPVCEFLPEKGERYYYLEATNPLHPEEIKATCAEWNNTLSDFARYEIRNCFRSEKEAMAKTNFYADTLRLYQQKLAMHKEKAFIKVA